MVVAMAVEKRELCKCRDRRRIAGEQHKLGKLELRDGKMKRVVVVEDITVKQQES